MMSMEEIVVVRMIENHLRHGVVSVQMAQRVVVRRIEDDRMVLVAVIMVVMVMRVVVWIVVWMMVMGVILQLLTLIR